MSDHSRRADFSRLVGANDDPYGGRDGSGAGGPPYDPGMEARVASLEGMLQGIHLTLATMSERMSNLATRADVAALSAKLDGKADKADTAGISAKLDGKADAKDLSRLDGRVGRIPTIPMLLGSLAILTMLYEAWPWISAHMLR